MRLTGITTYIFDMDDTMYEEMQYVRAAMEHVAEYVEREHGIEKERIYLFCMDLMEEQGRGAIFDMMIEEFHLKESVEKLVEVYRDTRPSLTLYGDAEALLKEVERQGMKTGLITDGNAKVQKAKVEGLNLMNRIQSVVLTDA
ncbi:MAG: HAD hydrolase-like protein, partial [Lachnospiraceae bacterium]|nr:HAD hydrolase-like protein [Lachnospiraceae bacterium]